MFHFHFTIQPHCHNFATLHRQWWLLHLWGFQFHCTGWYNLLFTGSILIPQAQTYCTCLTELIPGTKKMCQFKFWKGFVGTNILGRNVTLAKKFKIWTISVSASSIFFLLNKYFNYVIYDTSSWGLELTQMLHST
jgi:hypothetical protein